MPLILLCGYPCSGKTTVTKHLVEMLRERYSEGDIEIVSEEAIARANSAYKGDEDKDPRDTILSNPAMEKQLRSQIKSETEKMLSKRKGSLTGIVVVDASNYMKALRYDTYCIAKAIGQKQAIIYCTTSEATCREINSTLGRYSTELLTDMIGRFECPNPNARWDSPLYKINLPGPSVSPDSQEEFAISMDNLVSCVIGDLLQSKTKVKPNKSTIPTRSAASDYIQTVEKATNRVINLILEAQSKGEEKMCLPDQEDVTLQLATNLEAWTPTTLIKAKHNFLAFVRSGLGAGVDSRVTKHANEDEVSALFVRFLSNEAQRDAHLV
ncbi:hypothetical protein Aperf_G00000061670 [Anoplocephala perfoliata]